MAAPTNRSRAASERQDQIQAWWNEGVPVNEIAQRLGSTAGSIGVTIVKMRAQGRYLPYRHVFKENKHPEMRDAKDDRHLVVQPTRPAPTSRRCRRCDYVGPVIEFGSRRSVCIRCLRAEGRAHYQRHVEDRRRKAKEWREANPEKTRAHWQVKNALKSGRLVRPEACERCGTVTTRLNAHHDDYSRPLAVEWLCTSCHRRHHAALNIAAASVERAAA